MPKRKADSEEIQGRKQPPPALRRNIHSNSTNIPGPSIVQPIQVASKDDRYSTSHNGVRGLLLPPRKTRDRIWANALGSQTIHLRYTGAEITFVGGGGMPSKEISNMPLDGTTTSAPPTSQSQLSTNCRCNMASQTATATTSSAATDLPQPTQLRASETERSQRYPHRHQFLLH